MKDVLFFGCVNYPGHYLHHRVREWRNAHGGSTLRFDSTPWGSQIDGGLCLREQPEQPDGKVSYHIKDGWSCVAFWDRSGDERPGSNTVFLVAEVMPALAILDLARAQWPEIFQRRGFPLTQREGKPLPIVYVGAFGCATRFD